MAGAYPVELMELGGHLPAEEVSSPPRAQDHRTGGPRAHFNIQHLLYSEIKEFFEAEGVSETKNQGLRVIQWEV